MTVSLSPLTFLPDDQKEPVMESATFAVTIIPTTITIIPSTTKNPLPLTPESTGVGRTRRLDLISPLSSASEWLLGIIWASFSYFYLPDDWPRIHVSLILQSAGWAVITLGVLIMLWSLAGLGLRRTHGVDADFLVQTGLYRWTRNPQIIGFSLGMIGFITLWPSWHMLVSILLLVVLLHLMVITEEEHLLAKHGAVYLRYCDQVPRYIRMPYRRH